MPFKTANSSFILLRLLLSMRLWAVFLAILRPAAVVAVLCFFLPAPTPLPGALVVSFAPATGALPAALLTALAAEPGLICSCWRGFIWMIFLERVGGGGRANVVSLASLLAEEEARLRALTVSEACMG